MIYDSNIELDKNRAKERLEWLIAKGKQFEIKEKRQRRSIAQNSYLHLILTWYAIEYGESVEFVKQEVFKKHINGHIFKSEFVNRKTGEMREDWRSTASLDSAELTSAIDRFRNYSSKEAGIYLPTPDDMHLIQQMEREISKYDKQYL
tara:strand:- start:33123 stop:33566 length:444 start_codon:yes stop_codon:yes gene_type:complete